MNVIWTVTPAKSMLESQLHTRCFFIINDMHRSLIGIMWFETFKLLTGVPLLPNSLKVWHLRVFSDNVILTRLRAVKVAF